MKGEVENLREAIEDTWTAVSDLVDTAKMADESAEYQRGLDAAVQAMLRNLP